MGSPSIIARALAPARKTTIAGMICAGAIAGSASREMAMKRATPVSQQLAVQTSSDHGVAGL